jgi:hypothetical protein
MAGPFIFISQSRVKDGKLEDFKRGLREMAEFVEANEPRVIAFEAYLNDDGTEATGVQIHPDADSMAFHMQVAFEKIMEFDQYLDTQASRSTSSATSLVPADGNPRWGGPRTTPPSTRSWTPSRLTARQETPASSRSPAYFVSR